VLVFHFPLRATHSQYPDSTIPRFAAGTVAGAYLFIALAVGGWPAWSPNPASGRKHHHPLDNNSYSRVALQTAIRHFRGILSKPNNMLMPSALSCDSSQPQLTRLQAALFASPPASPPQLSSQNAIGNIFSTCRNLQALLSGPTTAPALPEPITPPTSSHAQLPTPPLTHAPPPLRLRLRSRKADAAVNGPDHGAARKRIVKRAPPRGVNKRRRTLDDDMGRDDDVDSDLDIGAEEADEQPANDSGEPAMPQTPKRARVAPEIIPLGLERSDYHTLHADGIPDGSAAEGTEVETEADGETWSTEEDRMLVELVLEKLKLSKMDWQECARSLGKDRHSLGRRWKSLISHGDIGLKNGRSSRRMPLRGTWR
jgi:hypothetical protein